MTGICSPEFIAAAAGLFIEGGSWDAGRIAEHGGGRVVSRHAVIDMGSAHGDPMLIRFDMQGFATFKGQSMNMFLLVVNNFVMHQIQQVIQPQWRVGDINGQATLILITQGGMLHRQVKFKRVHVDSFHFESPLAGPPAFDSPDPAPAMNVEMSANNSHRTYPQQAAQVLDYVAKKRFKLFF
jgi:hypothetical protein